jgi:hypothetical protein
MFSLLSVFLKESLLVHLDLVFIKNSNTHQKI